MSEVEVRMLVGLLAFAGLFALAGASMKLYKNHWKGKLPTLLHLVVTERGHSKFNDYIDIIDDDILPACPICTFPLSQKDRETFWCGPCKKKIKKDAVQDVHYVFRSKEISGEVLMPSYRLSDTEKRRIKRFFQAPGVLSGKKLVCPECKNEVQRKARFFPRLGWKYECKSCSNPEPKEVLSPAELTFLDQRHAMDYISLEQAPRFVIDHTLRTNIWTWEDMPHRFLLVEGKVMEETGSKRSLRSFLQRRSGQN